MVAVPNPVTVAAGSKSLASVWNDDVRDAATYFLENIGGFGHRNGLVNPHFDIWQGSTSLAITSSATPQYHADQWCTRRNGATGCTVSRQTGPTGQRYKLRIQRDSGNTNTTAIETMQPLETPESYRLAGQSCQLKVALAAGSNFSATSSLVTIKVTYGTGTDQAPPASTWTGTTDALSATQAITTTMTDYEFDVTIPSGATQVQVSVTWTPVGTASTNDYVDIGAAQLTAGKMAAWERLPMAMQLQRCQRFYFQLGPYGATRNFCTGFAFSTTLGVCFLQFPVPMRTAPTLAFSATNDFTCQGQSAYSSTGITTSAGVPPSATSAQIDVTTSGMTAREGLFLSNAQDTTNAAIYVNARL